MESINDPKLMKDIFKYYNEIISEQKEKLNPQIAESIKTNYEASPKLAVLFASYIVDRLGYNKSPQVVGESSYLKVKSRRFYRGAENIDYLAQTLIDFDYFKGSGIYDSGLYYSPRKRVAEFYANGENAAICSFKISPDCNILTAKHKKELIKEVVSRYGTPAIKSTQKHNAELEWFFSYLDSTSEEERKFWVGLSCKDFNQVAAILGYDATETYNTPRELILFNRGKIIIKDKVLNTILKESKTYKHFQVSTDLISNNDAEDTVTLQH